MWPAILGMTFALVPAERAAFAGGLILGVAGLGNALGPLLGGLLTDELSWRAIFYLNLPIAAFAALGDVGEGARAGAARAPASGSTTPGSSRSRSGSCSCSSPSTSPPTGGSPILACWRWRPARCSALVAFAVIEPRMGTAALVPKEVIDNRGFAAACLTVLCLSAVFFSAILYGPQLMEKILGYYGARGRGRDAADAGHVRRRRLRLRPDRRAGRAARGDRRRHRAARGRPAAALVLRRRVRLCRPGAGPAGDGHRGRALLPDDHDRRGHVSRPLAVESRRRDHLHVPGRRRRARPRADARRSSRSARRTRSRATRPRSGCATAPSSRA